jgi:DNA polymerase-3 subunit alpha
MFDALEPILKPTNGVIVYQEQVMQIVQAIGGFSLGGADLVRRAMGKKIKEEMDRLKGEFADGAQMKGFNRVRAEELFDLIVKFAGYGFNKSHSAAYAMVTFQTAYLKAHYPQEFMAALLTSEQNNTDKIVGYTEELERLHIKLLPPDITMSEVAFTPVTENGEKGILFGLGAIKGVGAAAIGVMLEERRDQGFKDLNDFVSRMDTQKVNKKVIESLIKSGAMDRFGFSRRALLEQIEEVIQSSKDASDLRAQAQNSLFGESSDMLGVVVNIKPMDEYDMKHILSLEKESIGLYISGHPLDEYKDEIKRIKYTTSSQVEEIASGSKALFVGKIEEITTKISKKGNKFAILTLLDMHGSMEFMMFERAMERLNELGTQRPIAIYAEVVKDEGDVSFKVIKVLSLDEARRQRTDIKKDDPAPTSSTPVQIMDAGAEGGSCVASSVFGDGAIGGGAASDPAAIYVADMESKGQLAIDTNADIYAAPTPDFIHTYEEPRELELVVELSTDTSVLEQISRTLQANPGALRARLIIKSGKERVKEIELPNVGESFADEVKRIDGVAVN